MKGNLWVKQTAGALAIFLSSASAMGLLLAAQSGQQSQQQDQQGQAPPKDKQKPKKGQSSDQSNTQGGAQPADNSGGNANPPPAASNPPAAGKPAGADKPAPLFGGSLNLKSSRQSKDSATMGFNGVDPNGQVQKSFLSAAANNTDRGKAQQMAAYKVDPQELAQFIQEGELNPAAAPAPPQKSN